MSLETIFLQSTDPNPNSNLNFANALGFAVFSNYSQSPSATLTEVQTEALVKNGVSIALAEARSTVNNNEPTFSTLFSDTIGIGLDGSSSGSANSQAKVVANFAVGANQTLSFDFYANLSLLAKEIENSDAEYNQAQSKTAFLVLDTTNPNQPKILDYFGIRGNLISSKKIGNLKLGSSRNVTLSYQDRTSDIDGNNGQDSITVSVIGRYQNKFKQNTNITIIEINASAISFIGDTLIGNLGQDVIYGTIKNDSLKGSKLADKIYGSLGNDTLNGRGDNDILEGGQGNDWLYGGEGNDKLHGGWDNDVLIGASGSDVLVGGDGNDKFVFNRGDSLLRGEFDVIPDFEVGMDKIVFQGWGNINSANWLNRMFCQGQITDTSDGVLFNFNTRQTQGSLLLSGVTSNLITSESIAFI
jgi:serralysin